MNLLTLLDKNLTSVNPVAHKTANPPQKTDKSSTPVGLSSREALYILERDGKNELRHKKRISPLRIFANQYKDIMTVILLVCTFVSVLMGEYVEAIAIAAIVLMNGVLGFIQEYKTEKTLEALKGMSSPMARVYRDGILTQVASSDIVVGDVIKLKSGDKIPADGVILSCTSLESDEAMLTGESLPVKKSCHQSATMNDAPDTSRVFMGCVITKGHCLAVITETGMKTKMGSIALMLQDIEEEQTPLQRRLEKLSKYIAIGCLAICTIVTVTGIFRGEPFMQMLILGVSLAVAAVPEGLPAIVTISLALSVSRMVKRNALVRRLHAVETLGCATVICSDKTGTLTQNRMTATHVFLNNARNKADSISKKEPCSALLLFAITLCNNAELSPNGAASYGDSTEICLLNLATSHGYSQEKLKETYERVSEIPFDSTRKRMSVVIKDENNQQILYVKGGYDILIDRCNSVQNGGEVQPLTPMQKGAIEEQNNKMADMALRVICVAYKKITPLSDPTSEEGLTFIGLIGMIDPPRKEVKGAVLSCFKAGIKTVMITGDHKKTAIAIAKEVGIFHKGDMVLTGDELESMNPDELAKLVGKVTVFARVSPSHKLLIVRALKKQGHIVAMTGDGVNDAPAIKEADIGVSMGISGTDVTREASEIVLLDDNFATLVGAVDEGRSIYNNIRKFIRYLLACNIGEVLTMFLGMLFGMPIILFPIQILLVNLVTDGLPAIALGLEPADKRAMSTPPRRADESVFSNGLATKIIIRGILIGFTTLSSFITLYKMTGSEDIARSGALFALIFAQLIHVFECKSEEKGLFGIPYFNNIKLVLASLLSLVTLLLVLYLPPLQAIFSTVAMGLTEVAVPVVYCLIAPLLIAVFSRGRRRGIKDNK